MVETSMFEAMCHFNLDDFTHCFRRSDDGAYSRPHVSQSYVFQCADGKWIALHMSSPPKFWENLAIAVGQPDMLQLDMFESREARIANYEKVIDFLAPIFKTRTRQQWCDILRNFEVPHAPVNTSEEAIKSEQAKALSLCIEDANGPHGVFKTIRSPVTFDGQRALDITALRCLGRTTKSWLPR